MSLPVATSSVDSSTSTSGLPEHSPPSATLRAPRHCSPALRSRPGTERCYSLPGRTVVRSNGPPSRPSRIPRTRRAAFLDPSASSIDVLQIEASICCRLTVAGCNRHIGALHHISNAIVTRALLLARDALRVAGGSHHRPDPAPPRILSDPNKWTLQPSLARPDRSARTQSVMGAMPVGPRTPSKSHADTLSPTYFRFAGLSDVGGVRHPWCWRRLSGFMTRR
jgi:hypothetical protein